MKRLDELAETVAAIREGEWAADLDESPDCGESISISCEGAFIATVMGGDEFPCLENSGREKFDAETRNATVAIVALRNNADWLIRVARAAEKISAFDVSALCEIPAHKPLRHLRCGACQLAARIEELRAALEAK